MTPIRRTLPLLASLAAVLAGCGSSSSTSSTTSPPTTAPPAAASTPGLTSAKVAIRSYAFAPATVHVKVGGKITFTNLDPTAHTASADDGTSFESGTLNNAQSKTVTFSKAGTFAYHCAFHAFMKGSVVVS